ncbi:hypothetical protein MauCBS54593_000285 [Microsporum audouinii]
MKKGSFVPDNPTDLLAIEAEHDTCNAENPQKAQYLPGEINAHVYLIADKYIIPGLKTTAKQKLEHWLQHNWEARQYISILGLAFGPDRPKIPALQTLLSQAAVQNLAALRDSPTFHEFLKGYPEFASEFSVLLMGRVDQPEDQLR